MASLIFAVIAGIFSLILLILSSEVAVKKIARLMHHYGYSATFGGLTVFSIATTLPENFAHLAASVGILRGTLDYEIASATVLGANIGSDVVQQTLILGIVVLLMGKLVFTKDFLLTAYLPMIGTTLLTLILAWDRTLSRVDGLILLGCFVAYMIFLYRKEHQHHLSKHKDKIHPGKAFLISSLALFVMLVSAHFLLTSSQTIVAFTGVGGSLIGVLTLGIAAASPEFFTAVAAIRQKNVGVSLGALIGSNITNPLLAIGGGALLSTYWVPKPLIYWDLPMETLTAALLLIYLLLSDRKLAKKGAIYLICLYFVYLIIRLKFFAID
jgi:cation:H+ antiporter